MPGLSLHLELALSILAVGFTVWVLVLQPLGLLRSMPRRQFIGLQMRIVRHWIRVLVPVTALVLLLAILRSHAAAWPAAIAFASALLAALWAVPRALRSGGQTLAAEGGASSPALDAGDFLADGGGAGTRVWHRVVLFCVVGLVGGEAVNAHELLHRGFGEHHAVAAPSASMERERHVADAATALAVRNLETEVARLLAARGEASTEPISRAWSAIFEGCTMQGEAHEALHAYLTPMAPIIEGLPSSTATDRVVAARGLLSRLSQWDAWFSQGT